MPTSTKEQNRLKNNKKYACDCGGKFIYKNNKQHFTTQKHKDYIKKYNLDVYK